MARFARRQGDAHRFGIAHLTDNDDIRRLAERRPQSSWKIRRIDSNLHLFHNAFLLGMFKLDRIFDRDDVFGFPAVDLVDERSQCRRFAGASRPSDQDQSIRQPRQLENVWRQAEVGEARRPQRQRTDRCRRAAPLMMKVDSKSPEAIEP